MSVKANEHRSGFVALAGRPSVGKSTLLNALAGEKVAIVSGKAQTTRNVIRAVVTRATGQIILLDTPGFHTPHHKLGEYMVRAARAAVHDADLIVFVFDAGRGWGPGDEEIYAELVKAGTPIILAGNKVDRTSDEGSEAIQAAVTGRNFVDSIAVSARARRNLEPLIDLVLAHLPEGPQYYPPDVVSDQPDKFVVSEAIREQVLAQTREEIPHSVAVDVDRLVEEEDSGLIRVDATVYVERDSQKGIIIGQGGRMLKTIGTAAREQIEAYFGAKVHLALWVKVRENWRMIERALREFGYDE